MPTGRSQDTIPTSYLVIDILGFKVRRISFVISFQELLIHGYICDFYLFQIPCSCCDILAQSLHAGREEVLSTTRINEPLNEARHLLRVRRINTSHIAIHISLPRRTEHGIPARLDGFSRWERGIVEPFYERIVSIVDR